MFKYYQCCVLVELSIATKDVNTNIYSTLKHPQEFSYCTTIRAANCAASEHLVPRRFGDQLEDVEDISHTFYREYDFEGSSKTFLILLDNFD